MSNNSIIEIKNAVPRLDSICFKECINWTISGSDNWAIIGPNGAGKTLLIDILTGKHALKCGEIKTLNNESVNKLVKSVAFSDIYSMTDVKNSYYQQRWNTGDEHEAPIVKDLFSKGEIEWVNFLTDTFAIYDLVDKPINLLSSGELRKALIIRSLLDKPKILILDNPFIGLDRQSRQTLNVFLQKISELEKIRIILVISNPKDIPSLVNKVLPIKDKRLFTPMSTEDFRKELDFQKELFSNQSNPSKIKSTPFFEDITYENVLILKNIQIRYGKRIILKDLNWTLKKGEKWALLGENGAGKSTLLSLLSGDNPQAYANDITLFDRKRGSGESIWDIKKRIGYISPEMHLYYLKNIPCIDVVGSGFFDTIGLYLKCSEKQKSIAFEWMQLFGIDHIKDISFLNISTGEQRLVLLARVFVKNPDLLILDEPLHGLDVNNKNRIKNIIEDFCSNGKSLIYVTHYEDEIPNLVSKRFILTKNKE